MAILTGAGPVERIVPALDYLGSSPDDRATIRAKTLRAYANNHIFKRLVGGEGSQSPIWKRPAKSRGLEEWVGRGSRFGQKGILGDRALLGTEEAYRAGSYKIRMDFRRHSASYSLKNTRLLSYGPYLDTFITEMEGRWMQERMARELMYRWRVSATADNIRYPSGITTFSTLVSSSVLNVAEIKKFARMGRALNISEVNLDVQDMRKEGLSMSYSTRGNMVISPPGALAALKSDTTNLDLEVADVTSDSGMKVALRGGYLQVDGNIIQEVPTLLDDSLADQSWAIEPIGLLGTTGTAPGLVVTPSDSSWTMYGTWDGDIATPTNYTNNTAIAYFENFLGASFEITEEESYTTQADGTTPFGDVDTGTWYYIAIYNHKDSGVSGGEAGKIGLYRYRASDMADNGNRIVFPANSRLSAATTTLGGMAYASGPFLNRVATSHPVGAYVFQINRKGTPVAFNILTGPNSIDWIAADETKVDIDDGDHGMRKDVFSQAVFGHEISKDRKGRPRHYLLIPSANKPFGLDSEYPTIT